MTVAALRRDLNAWEERSEVQPNLCTSTPATSSRMKGDRHNSNLLRIPNSRTSRSFPGKFSAETMTLVSRTTLI